MISSTLLGPLGILLASASRGLAFDDISIPLTVQADTEVEVTITNDIDDGAKSFDAEFTNFNLYLATTPPGWGTGPVCLLANGTKITTTSVKITIPADVVPAGASLEITAEEWNSDPDMDGPSGFQYSNTFRLQGATGNWSKSELEGNYLSEMDQVPCSAYACTRVCNDKYYDERTSNDDDVNAFKSTYECVAACPGVTLPSWDSVVGDDGDDDDSSSADSSKSATATVSASKSASVAVTTTATASTTPDASLTSTSSSTDAASSPSETGNHASQESIKTSGFLLVGLVAIFGLL